MVTVLEQLETDKVYIIGGLVDETPNKVSGGYYFINILHNISIELQINTMLLQAVNATKNEQSAHH